MIAVITHSVSAGGTVDDTAAVDGAAWDADHVITGLMGLSQGGTNADLSSTGGAGQVVKQESAGAAFTVGTVAASEIANSAALTKTDDTNVTLTLGGTPATALLAATSITVGWSGTLAATRGGFGADISAQSGVPLFTTGAATFTGTTGTGDFVRATSPAITTPTGIVKGDVGLGNVDNTSDLNKPISTATQTALNDKVTGPASTPGSGIVALYADTTGKLLTVGGGAPAGSFVGTIDTQTLTNKTINGPDNTITNIDIGSLDASGTPSASTYLRGDGSWTTPPGGGDLLSTNNLNDVDDADEAADNIGAYRAGTIVGTVSETSGVPTGAIIESGSNANGNYVKYADGTMICWGAKAAPTISAWSGSGNLFYSQLSSFSFPATFASTPTGQLTFSDNNVSARAAQICTYNFSTTGINTIYITTVISGASTASTGSNLYFTAFGRWF